MDKKKKVELEVLNISNSQEQAGAYALVLGCLLYTSDAADD